MLCIQIELPGVGGYGAALYCGTGCFHRRECLGGKKYSKDEKGQHVKEERKNVDKTINELEEASKLLASCTYEKDTKWGKEVMINHSLSHSSLPFSNFSPNNERTYEYADRIVIRVSC